MEKKVGHHYTTITVLSPDERYTISTIGSCGRTPNSARRHALEKINRYPLLRQEGLKYRVSTT